MVAEEQSLWQDKTVFAKVEEQYKTTTIDEIIKKKETPNFSDLKILSQFNKTYILCEDKKNNHLIIIDQHAADEKVVFENLKKNFETKERQSQVLLFPITIELAIREAEFF